MPQNLVLCRLLAARYGVLLALVLTLSAGGLRRAAAAEQVATSGQERDESDTNVDDEDRNGASVTDASPEPLKTFNYNETITAKDTDDTFFSITKAPFKEDNVYLLIVKSKQILTPTALVYVMNGNQTIAKFENIPNVKDITSSLNDANLSNNLLNLSADDLLKIKHRYFITIGKIGVFKDSENIGHSNADVQLTKEINAANLSWTKNSESLKDAKTFEVIFKADMAAVQPNIIGNVFLDFSIVKEDKVQEIPPHHVMKPFTISVSLSFRGYKLDEHERIFPFLVFGGDKSLQKYTTRTERSVRDHLPAVFSETIHDFGGNTANVYMKNVCFNDETLKFYAQVESHHGSPSESSASSYFDSNQKTYFDNINMSQFFKIIMVQCGQRNDNYGLTGYSAFSLAVCIGSAPTEPNNLQPVCIVLVLIVGVTFFINAMSYLYVMGSVSI